MVSLLSHLIAVCLMIKATWSASDKPNIVMFVIDDMGWNDVGYQGAEYPTPTIDKLAKEGIALRQYYVQPLCSPSRSCLMAGKSAYDLGMSDGVITNGHPLGLGLNETTFVQLLKGGNYATHAVGESSSSACIG